MTGFGFWLHVALVCGWLSFMFPGFARADEVRDVHETVLDGTIYSMRRDQCIAQKTGNLLAAQSQDQRLREEREQYRRLTGRVYELPPCELFVLAVPWR